MESKKNLKESIAEINCILRSSWRRSIEIVLSILIILVLLLCLGINPSNRPIEQYGMYNMLHLVKGFLLIYSFFIMGGIRRICSRELLGWSESYKYVVRAVLRILIATMQLMISAFFTLEILTIL